MLGRLRMSVSECIEAYINLAKDVFHVESNYIDAGKMLSGHKFPGGKLEEAVQKIVEKYRCGTSNLMYEDTYERSGKPPCRRCFSILSIETYAVADFSGKLCSSNTGL